MYSAGQLVRYFLYFIIPYVIARLLYDSWRENKNQWYKLILAIPIGLVSLFFFINWVLGQLWPYLSILFPNFFK